MSLVRMAAMMLAAMVLVGCAGSKYENAVTRFPPVPQDKGRIYFYQPQPEMMSSVQQKMRVNGVVVGRNKPGAFFFVDRPAGSYTVTNLYWTGDGVSFMLDAGQTRYVRIVAESLGSTSASGKLMMELVDPPEMAEREMRRLRYWGAASSEQVSGL
ncbi:DUF2846 domain-containing protein [Achromobacter xylosoxidans]|jgi:hypothetical protein|uniref:DUF2846 domain-containing protein n=1 Tax=Alcaligenes xylosoxydans xylosoxydans TaxID=85698 RepID=UPI0006C6E09A|nr:DUF2846 domain-containing protein [Achromobacter xylosoxidans]KAA5924727.1 DUF2846 domain-containing protein [Achromobacter xylosoxidans]MBK1979681.1 DUF2846 domain-containing protein [Achromobacter xylosoxidans]QKI72796.1 DUF2846 domain-containing protein [Achromobacter xylosoxidans]CUI47812.1 Protein of uncharacterised function (DUF2846) [Achromobacter xylosoxidans]CUI75656.1 Protein of uncharacterised function (DUF2846) [Achromobacter xylosoxidans]